MDVPRLKVPPREKLRPGDRIAYEQRGELKWGTVIPKSEWVEWVTRNGHTGLSQGIAEDREPVYARFDSSYEPGWNGYRSLVAYKPGPRTQTVVPCAVCKKDSLEDDYLCGDCRAT